MSVAAIAASERNSSVSSTIAIATPIELADRRVLLGGEVDQDAALLDLAPSGSAVSAAAISASPSAFSISAGSVE